MERSEHLKFCRICKNRRMSSQKGIICGLTGDIAKFEGECPDFDLDAEHQKELEQQKNKKSFEYEPVASYIIPKQLMKRYNGAVLLLPILFVAAHLLFSIGVRRYASGISFWFLVVLFLVYLINAGLYRKFPLPTVTISTIFSAVAILTLLLGVFRYYGPYLFISVTIFFSYLFILSQLHSYKQKA